MFFAPGCAALLTFGGSVLTVTGTLAGVALTQRHQRRIAEQQAAADRLSTIRKDRIEQIAQFMTAAIAVEQAAEERGASGHTPEGAEAVVKQMWLRERGVFLFCGDALRAATKSYANKLKQAALDGTEGVVVDRYYEAERWKFLQEAQKELDIDPPPQAGTGA
jgi:hypothetical protein